MARAPTFSLIAVADSNNIGDDGAQLVDFLQRLPSRWRATAITAEHGSMGKTLLDAGVATRYLPLPPLQWLTLPLRLATVLRIRRLLRQEKPNCVYANGVKAAWYWTQAARATGTPVLWHCRDMTPNRRLDTLLAAAVVGLSLTAMPLQLGLPTMRRRRSTLSITVSTWRGSSVARLCRAQRCCNLLGERF